MAVVVAVGLQAMMNLPSVWGHPRIAFAASEIPSIGEAAPTLEQTRLLHQ